MQDNGQIHRELHEIWQHNWLRSALDTMFGVGEPTVEVVDGVSPRVAFKVRRGFQLGVVATEIIYRRDPVELLDCFRCAACSWHQQNGKPVRPLRPRLVCLGCHQRLNPKLMSDLIDHRDRRLWLVEGDRWRCGAFGAPLAEVDLLPRKDGYRPEWAVHWVERKRPPT